MRKAIASVDPSLVIDDVNLYSQVVSTDFKQQNMIATLTSLFGLLGLVLAAVGLYGVMAYTVEQRTNEIGLRMALGADRGHVIAMVLRGATLQIGIGLGIGIPLAVLAAKLMKDQLYGVQPWDPVDAGGGHSIACVGSADGIDSASEPRCRSGADGCATQRVVAYYVKPINTLTEPITTRKPASARRSDGAWSEARECTGHNGLRSMIRPANGRRRTSISGFNSSGWFNSLLMGLRFRGNDQRM